MPRPSPPATPPTAAPPPPPDVGTPIYAYINVVVTGGTALKPTYTNATKRFIPGDTSLNGHYEASFRLLDYNATFTLGLPTGANSEGLGAGKATYNFNNHFEKSIGDSSSLVDQRVRKSFTSVGRLPTSRPAPPSSYPST